MKLIDTVKKFFEPQKSPEERRREAEMNYRLQTRAFQRYDAELARTIEKFKQIIVSAESSGQHSNALRAVRFYRQLNATRDKVASVRMHFDMLHSMAGVGDVMLKFMDSCKELGCDLSQQINLESLGTSELNLEGGLEKLNFLSDKLEQAFETISDSLDSMSGDASYATAADMETLNRIMGTENKAAEPVRETSRAKETGRGRHAQAESVKSEEQAAPAPGDKADAKTLDDLMKEFDSINV